MRVVESAASGGKRLLNVFDSNQGVDVEPLAVAGVAIDFLRSFAFVDLDGFALYVFGSAVGTADATNREILLFLFVLEFRHYILLGESTLWARSLLPGGGCWWLAWVREFAIGEAE